MDTTKIIISAVQGGVTAGLSAATVSLNRSWKNKKIANAVMPIPNDDPEFDKKVKKIKRKYSLGEAARNLVVVGAEVTLGALAANYVSDCLIVDDTAASSELTIIDF